MSSRFSHRFQKEIGHRRQSNPPTNDRETEQLRNSNWKPMDAIQEESLSVPSSSSSSSQIEEITDQEEFSTEGPEITKSQIEMDEMCIGLLTVLQTQRILIQKLTFRRKVDIGVAAVLLVAMLFFLVLILVMEDASFPSHITPT